MSGSAVFEPARDQVALPFEQPQQHFFMIAAEDVEFDVTIGKVAQSVDHAARLWPAVNQVAQHDYMIPGLGPDDNLGTYLGQQLVEQVETAVDIANRIGTDAVRHARRCGQAVPDLTFALTKLREKHACDHRIIQFQSEP